ncbi:MAG: alpha/beta fold hydrolase [Gaiellales bacterium]
MRASEATILRGFSQNRVDVDGTRISYRVAGSGDPILLIHGLGGAASNWSAVARRLVARHRVLVVDLPGHGSSAAFPPEADDLGLFVDAVRACADDAAMRGAVVVGHSFGGVVAVGMAVQQTPHVRALVLAAPSGISSSTVRNRVGLALLPRLRPSRLTGPLREPISRRVGLRRVAFAGLVSDAASLAPEATLGFIEGAVAATSTRAAAGALLNGDVRLELHRVRVPAMVVWGARDRILPVDDGFEYARRLRAPLRVLPDTGHLLIGERPAEVASLVTQWIGSLRPGAVGLSALSTA